MKLNIPELADGEIYIGAIGDAAGNLHHVILLPGEIEDANWKKSMEWADGLGGDLPDRIEQAMLWANHRDQFQNDWYWSNETHHHESGWAWFQRFDYGTQVSCHEVTELRARAVRRLVIE